MFQSSIIIPRWYQLEAIDSIYNYFMNNNGNPLIGLPGGTGKSIIPAIFIHKVMQHWPHQRFLMITSVKELIEQNAEKLRIVWPTAPLGIYSAGLKQKQSAFPIIYGGIQSMIKNPSIFGHRDIIFIDEAHLVSQDESSMYLTFIATMRLINPNLKIVGMTATPFRMGQGYIIEDGLFTDFCYDMTNIEGFNKLLDEGYILPLVPKRMRTHLNIDNVSISKGDYIGSQLEQAIDKDEITFSALREAAELGQNRKCWLIFASGIDHAEHIATQLQTFGIDCAAVHSRQKDYGKNESYNDQAIRAFKTGELRSIVNYGKLTVGFDNPMIDLLIDLRPTMSVPLHIQKYCRGTRPSPETNKKDCLVLDFAKNTQRLGCINDPIIPRKKGSKEGDIPVKLCEACGTYNHLKVRFCTNCGHEFQFQVKIVPKSGNDEILRSDQPIIEMYQVHKAIYQKKQKENHNPYIKITYFCGMMAFNEFIFPEATKPFMKHLYHKWWMQRHASPPPVTTDDALKYHSELKTPKRITVHVNREFPEIKSVEF